MSDHPAGGAPRQRQSQLRYHSLAFLQMPSRFCCWTSGRPKCGPCMQMKPIVHAWQTRGYRSVRSIRRRILKHRASSTSIRFLVS